MWWYKHPVWSQDLQQGRAGGLQSQNCSRAGCLCKVLQESCCLLIISLSLSTWALVISSVCQLHGSQTPQVTARASRQGRGDRRENMLDACCFLRSGLQSQAASFPPVFLGQSSDSCPSRLWAEMVGLPLQQEQESYACWHSCLWKP